MTRRIVAYVLAVVSALGAGGWSSTARADSSKGGAFRLPEYGARAWGMAGAAVATVDDESAVDWNPARLVLLPGAVGGVSTVNLVPGTSARQTQVVYARVLDRYKGDADEVGRHALGIQFTNLALDVGDANYGENFLRAAYAYSLDRFLSVAIAGELFFSNSDVPGFDAWGTSVDWALRAAFTERTEIALVGRDLFSRYTYDDGRDYEKERAITLGVAGRLHQELRVEGDVVWDHGDIGRVLVGLETGFIFEYLSLRAGLATLSSGESRSIPYFGFTVRGPKHRFTVLYSAGLDDPDDGFDDTHRFALGVRL